MRSLSTHLLVTILLTLITSSRATADFALFEYHWNAVGDGIYLGNNSSSPGTTSTGSVAFALFADGLDWAEVNGFPVLIPAALVYTSSSAAASQPDIYDTPFGLTVHLTDPYTGESTQLTFLGKIQGELTATTSSLNATFDSPLTQQVGLAGLTYHVTADPDFASLPYPGAAPTFLGLQVRVSSERTATSDDADPSPVSTVPEPSSLLLLGLAVPLVVYSRRKRRSRRFEEPADLDRMANLG